MFFQPSEVGKSVGDDAVQRCTQRIFLAVRRYMDYDRNMIYKHIASMVISLRQARDLHGSFAGGWVRMSMRNDVFPASTLKNMLAYVPRYIWNHA